MRLRSFLNLSVLSICFFTFFSLLFLLPCFSLFLVSSSTFLSIWFFSLFSQLRRWHIAEYDEDIGRWKPKSVDGSTVPVRSWFFQSVPFTRTEHSLLRFACSCTNRSKKWEIMLFGLYSVSTTFEDACCACYRVCIRNYLFNVTNIKIVIIQKCLK